jgi:hypothetical protein
MFGLMRAKKCEMTDAEKHFRRLHYCGTCKTTGALYGQKSRLLLNYDTVFLAEILSSLSGENVKNWSRAYQSYNCLSLPKEAMPFSLQFAATANVILTEFKIADHISDSRKRRFRIARRVFSKEFLEAERALKDWNFPLETVRNLLATQEKLEAESVSLDEFAAPTARTTAIFFAEGVKLTGEAELENLALEIGFAFGKLVYLIDAFEDYEKDFRTNQFNAFRAAFRLEESRLSVDAKRKITGLLHELESEIIAKIYKLPMADAQKRLFASRLRQNLQKKLKTNLPILQKSNACPPKPRQSFTDRWRRARRISSDLTASLQRNWEIPLVFAFVFVVALVAPAQARQAKSWPDCVSLSFNLMFLGAVFGAVLASAKTIFMSSPGEFFARQRKRRKNENRGGWCDCCYCDCCCDCDCCDGCCENCDCCCCGGD